MGSMKCPLFISSFPFLFVPLVSFLVLIPHRAFKGIKLDLSLGEDRHVTIDE